MSERHPKWQRASHGDHIPAGQPYRHEYSGHSNCISAEYVATEDVRVEMSSQYDPKWFVDSSWKPPLDLPTERSLILAEVDDRYTEDKVLLTGPHRDKGNTWWSWDTRLSVIPDDINSFEILWTEAAR